MMRILMTIFLLLAAVVPAGLAQAQGRVDDPAALTHIEGMVEALTAEDAGRNIRAQVRVLSDIGESWSFLVATKALIQANDGRDIPFSELKVGDRVSMDYVIYRYSPKKPRVFEAQAIRLQ